MLCARLAEGSTNRRNTVTEVRERERGITVDGDEEKRKKEEEKQNLHRDKAWGKMRVPTKSGGQIKMGTNPIKLTPMPNYMTNQQFYMRVRSLFEHQCNR